MYGMCFNIIIGINGINACISVVCTGWVLLLLLQAATGYANQATG